MQFIQGKDRTQTVLFLESLDQIIGKDNEVRMIDVFIESISLKDFEFCIKTTKEGRPAYHPKDILRLFVYGYLNRIRSSRQLEKECMRNIEVMWLMRQLVPDHNTISNFRRDNDKAIRKVFKHTVSIAKNFELIGSKLVAGDSTKLRAQNSKKNNFNEAKIEKHQAYIDANLSEYLRALEEADADAVDPQQVAHKEVIEQQIAKLTACKEGYENLSKQLKESGDLQISTSDPDSRKLITSNNTSDIGYNVQTVVDAKHNLLIDYKVTNENDNKAMSGMLRRSKVILGTSDFTALYDKGYHCGIEIKKAMDLGMTTLVAIPGPTPFAPKEKYHLADFKYDEATDTYRCPEQHTLKTTGTWYHKSNAGYQVKQYTTDACQSCPVRAFCTKSKKGRLIERTEYASYIDQNRINIENNRALYKQRQAIVEHPYGTIKRQWGFNYIMTKKGMKRASSDVGLMCIAYNLRRLMNILDQNALAKFFKELATLFFTKMASAKEYISKIRQPIFHINNHKNKLLAA